MPSPSERCSAQGKSSGFRSVPADGHTARRFSLVTHDERNQRPLHPLASTTAYSARQWTSASGASFATGASSRGGALVEPMGRTPIDKTITVTLDLSFRPANALLPFTGLHP